MEDTKGLDIHMYLRKVLKIIFYFFVSNIKQGKCLKYTFTFTSSKEKQNKNATKELIQIQITTGK